MSDTRVSRLRCEYLKNPVGIDEPRPRLSWQLNTSRRGAKQTAYRIFAASQRRILSEGKADLWDTGLVHSDQTTHIEYHGVALASRTHCHWLVEVTDETGKVTRSEVAFWSMGLLNSTDWRASWIAANPNVFARDAQAFSPTLTQPGTACLFRHEFQILSDVAKATVYLCARGIFEARLNGARIGEDIFAPEWTDYHTRIHYRTYDVTAHLQAGANCIGATLGDGWWSGFVGWQEQRGRYGCLQNSLLAQLEIECADGSHLIITSNDQWQCETSPILCSDFMMGETYDARREQAGWDSPGFRQKIAWLPAKKVAAPNSRLVAQPSEPVRIIETLKPVSLEPALLDPELLNPELLDPEPLNCAQLQKNTTQTFIFNLGQNIAGWVRLQLPALPAATKIVLRHGERLNHDGTLHQSNLRRARATDTYISRGDGPINWQPHFTFHGFQYVELSGLPRSVTATLSMVTGCVIHSAATPAGDFECSHEGVNRLWKNALWSQKDNFLSVPTDCPQRDERLGWTGDAQVFLRTATCNMDVAAFFTKWMVDVEDAQTAEGVFPDTAPRLPEDTHFVGLANLGGSAAWADAGIIIPFTLWRIYGDRRIIETHYDAMVAWLNWIDKTNPGGLRLNHLGNNYGDWLCIPSDTSFGTHSPMKSLIATAFWADGCAKLSRIAAELGKCEDQKRFRLMFERVRNSFQQEWLLANGQLRVDTQTAYLLALAFDLIPQKLRGQTTAHLVENIRNLDWHLSTGFVGVGLLNPQLTLAGHTDIAYRLLLQESYPAWLYPIKHGATTIWERWNGWTEEDGFYHPHMNSFNHYSLGSVVEWLIRHVAGIELETEVAGAQHFIICPYIGDGLKHAGATLLTLHGEIYSYWKTTANGLGFRVRIPANTTADIGIPAKKTHQILLEDVPLSYAKDVNNIQQDAARCWITLGAGDYQFKII